MTNTIIDLTIYQTISLEVKRQGGDLETLPADFGDKEAGEASISGVVFDEAGEWTVQFVALDNLNNPLFGEPLRVTVASNVRDLGTEELPSL